MSKILFNSLIDEETSKMKSWLKEHFEELGFIEKEC